MKQVAEKSYPPTQGCPQFAIAKSRPPLQDRSMRFWISITKAISAGLTGIALLVFVHPLRTGAAEPAPPLPESAPLTSIQQIRNLSPEQARAGLPVKIRAVATFSKPAFATLFIHDGTGGIFVEQSPKKDDDNYPKTGDELEVIGVTGALGERSNSFSPLQI